MNNFAPTILIIETQLSLEKSTTTSFELKNFWMKLLPANMQASIQEVLVINQGRLKRCKCAPEQMVLVVDHEQTPAMSLELFLFQCQTDRPSMGFSFSQNVEGECFFPNLSTKQVDMILESKKKDYADALRWAHIFYGRYDRATQSIRQRYEQCTYAYHAGTSSSETPSKGALFLDRDGVLIEDGRYLYEPERVVLRPGIVELIERARKESMYVFCLTNQSGIARGYFTLEQMHLCHQKIDELLAQHGVSVDQWFYSPFHPEGEVEAYKKHSLLRKPLAGMLMQVAQQYRINYEKSLMIGDNLSDQLDVKHLKVYLTQGHYSLAGAEAAIINDFQQIPL